jgi:hypothetical protein
MQAHFQSLDKAKETRVSQLHTEINLQDGQFPAARYSGIAQVAFPTVAVLEATFEICFVGIEWVIMVQDTNYFIVAGNCGAAAVRLHEDRLVQIIVR